MTPQEINANKALLQTLASFKYDPLGFVMAAFPWGKPNTPLEHFKGPRKWQREELKAFGEHLKQQAVAVQMGQDPKLWQCAIASGRGTGKTALYGMLTMFMMSCWWGSTTIITANTEGQLMSKTWPEICKWYRLAVNSPWFDVTATKMTPQPWFANLLQDQMKLDTGYYYAGVQTWSKENPDSFAGAHNNIGLLLLFDEASGIDESIWHVSLGFFTEKTVARAHYAFSNPRRTDGAFFECFHKNRAEWRTIHIDAREVEGTNTELYNQMIRLNGEDSDVVRVEVKGQFPSQAEDKFMSRNIVEHATTAPVNQPAGYFPLIIGIDVAGTGGDYCVVAFRQGMDARSIPWQYWRNTTTDQSVAKIANIIEEYTPDAVFMDADGMGAPMVDTLTNTLGFKIITPVRSGTLPAVNMYADERTRCYANLKDWLQQGGAIPNLQRLIDDLCAPKVIYQGVLNKIKLESKQELRKRGVASTDFSDPLAYTFYKPIASEAGKKKRKKRRLTKNVNPYYDAFE